MTIKYTPNPTARFHGRRPFGIPFPLVPAERIYLIPSFLFLIIKTSRPSTCQGISRMGAVRCVEEAGSHRRPRSEGPWMKAYQTQESRFAMREGLFLGIAALGAWLFLNHELLEGGSPP